MFNICQNCGQYRVDKIIDPAGPYAVCPHCDHEYLFQMHPLLIVGGASGTGKTTVLHQLIGQIPAAVLLEGDILWRAEFNKPADNYRDFFETWLRVCKNITQSGRPVVIFNAGMVVPENIEPCLERRYFSAVHYLALICDDQLIVERLQARPAGSETNQPEYIAKQLEFNQWLKDQAKSGELGITAIDTSAASITATSQQVAAWIFEKLQLDPPSASENLAL